MNSKRALIALAAGSLLLAVPGPGIAAQKAAGGTTKTTAAPQAADEAAILAVLAGLAAAASNADAEKMSTLFIIDATYVDEDGQHTRGREELKKRFAQGLERSGKSKIEVTPASVKIVGRDVAWVEGTSTRKTAVGVEPGARFAMLMQKQNGNWLISSATETPIVSKSAADHLNALDWMVGDWAAEQGTTKVRMNADWTSNKNFIDCKYVVEQAGALEKIDRQIIGWDPSKGQIVSWNFSSNGGFGYGSWSKRGKDWVIAAEGVDPAGTRTASVNIISGNDPNKFSWQSVDRVVDGLPVPDTDPVTVQRVAK